MVISSFMGRDYQASSDNTPRSNPLTLPFSLAAEAAHKTHEETQVPLVWASGPATVASSGNARREPTLPPRRVTLCARHSQPQVPLVPGRSQAWS